MHIFMTNDDGIGAIGLQRLARELAKHIGRVTIVAPDRERSSCSSALTLRERLYLKEQFPGVANLTAYSFTGTPADCAKFGLGYLLADDPPDLVVSGMNNGYNSGSDVIYSGTVAGALEGHLQKIPSLSVSGTHMDVAFLERSVPFVREFIRTVFVDGRFDGLLNLNIPDIPDIGWEHMKVCRVGQQHYRNVISPLLDEEGQIYYHVAGEYITTGEPDTDVHWLHQGYVTVVPLQWETTATNRLPEIKKIIEKTTRSVDSPAEI